MLTALHSKLVNPMVSLFCVSLYSALNDVPMRSIKSTSTLAPDDDPAIDAMHFIQKNGSFL